MGDGASVYSYLWGKVRRHIIKTGSVVEKFFVPCREDEHLHAVLFLPPSGKPERLIFVVPLVGSRASQQIINFRSFVRRHSALLSFEYRGHGLSSGTFNMEKSREDTIVMLQWAIDYARGHGIPLHAMSTCYSTLSLLSCFREGAGDHGITTIGAISGLVDTRRILSYQGFAGFYEMHTDQPPLDAGEFFQSLEEGVIDHGSASFRQALCMYMRDLFPELRITHDSFEELQYSRVDHIATLRQFHTFDPLKGIRVPEEVPCLFYYGVNDDLMELTTPEGRARYTSQIKALVPQAEIRWGNFDHFGRGADRDRVLQRFCDFFEMNEHTGVIV